MSAGVYRCVRCGTVWHMLRRRDCPTCGGAVTPSATGGAIRQADNETFRVGDLVEADPPVTAADREFPKHSEASHDD